MAALQTPAFAEGDQLQLIATDTGFVEEMPEYPRVAGQRLVGVHIGGANGPFDAGRFRVALGSGTGGVPLCVKITTRDGRYWSLNAFSTEAATVPFPAIDFRTNYLSRLAGYDLGDFAVRAAAMSDCADDVGGAIIPAVIATEPGQTLVLLVNAGNPISVAARFVAEPQDQTPCKRPGAGSSTGYNFICELPIGDRHGARDITIGIRDRNGRPIPETYTVLLP